ncbi:MAG: ribbon-helix-helix protein, CopG family [Candidatus Methylomirabilis oxygeniifera]|uniref:Ribbon-helix-helix protein, CopG family n=2 Tax=Candidatus Methylomirabilis TaxID=1170227 RepID=A0AAJ1AHR5_9BACT|nr:MAG: ribbon-helix-helix protein, CopG family [Candidatus Methylomirabilis oxyfera]MBZ0159999.1 ribbon-helix-helix protein, CopG family [Candidatus Methylomirabilis sp.]
MARTTIDIDTPLLRELKKLQAREGRSMGKIVSQLLAEALARRTRTPQPPKFQWTSRPMHALVDLSDKEAVYGVLDRDTE